MNSRAEKIVSLVLGSESLEGNNISKEEREAMTKRTEKELSLLVPPESVFPYAIDISDGKSIVMSNGLELRDLFATVVLHASIIKFGYEIDWKDCYIIADEMLKARNK